MPELGPVARLLPVRYPRDQALVEGRLVRRYKRFIADVELAGGEVVTAHCVNTGAMEGLVRPGARVWLSRAENPARKLAWTWELVESGGQILGANTALPNRLVRRLLDERRLPWLPGYERVEAERPLGERSRVDFVLARGGPGRRRRTLVEVKNCHLLYPDRRAYFPDAVSERAAHHLRELARARSTTTRCHVLFVCQVPGARSLRPSDAHDPTFATAAREARGAGVGFSALEVTHTPEEIQVVRRLPVDLKPYRVERVARWRAAGR
ncbi:MAG TPA: DNA/RNA nuclease SfsA [Thermoanaerobaculia bacterium]|nr:DNA/RNA nuclease SfsA [Thermoanaerobaculia bacterium]